MRDRVVARTPAYVVLLLAAGLLAPRLVQASGKLEVTKVSGSNGVTAISFPPSGLNFDHKFHAETVGATCDVCHEGSSTNTKLMTFPNHDTCGACHAEAIDETSPQKNCGLCHAKPDYKTNLPKNVAFFPQVTFDHKLHLDNKVSCESCHTATSFSAGKGNQTLPKMDTCVACHSQRNPRAAADCSTCHVKGFETTRPQDHGPLWAKVHGQGLTQATIDTKCSLCHTVANGNDCKSCHQRSDPPSTHTLAWKLSGHGNRAELERQSCSTCHDQSECISCHTTNEPFSHTGLWSSPYDRHCIRCHFEGASFVAGDLQGNCSLCHQNATVYARHQSLPRPAGHPSVGCQGCHVGGVGGPNIQHPYPPDDAQCLTCHL